MSAVTVPLETPPAPQAPQIARVPGVTGVTGVTEPAESVIQRSCTFVAAILSSAWALGVLVTLPEPLAGTFTVTDLYHVLQVGLAMVICALLWLGWWGQTRVPRPVVDADTDTDTDTATDAAAVLLRVANVRRHHRLAMACLVGSMLLIIAVIAWTTFTLSPLDPDLAHVVRASRWGIVILAVAGSVVVSTFCSEATRWAYVLLVTAVRLPIAFAATTTDPIGERISIATALVVMCFVLGEVYFLRTVAHAGDAALHDSTQAVIDTASQAAETTEASRIDGLVHDHILAALLLASRADDPEDAPMVRRSAAGALAALAEISAPEADEADGEEVSVPAFATQLIRDVRAEDPTIKTTGRGARSRPIPTDVATALSAAALEAVRNSLSHAAGTEARLVARRVTVRTSEEEVVVTVSDDGIGFDPSTATARRYGVSGSILGRMAGIEGGAAEVDSQPGRGTHVTVSWTDPEARVATPPGPDGGTEVTEAHSGETPAHAAKSPDPAGAGAAMRSYFAALGDSVSRNVALAPTVRASIGVLAGTLYMSIASQDLFDPAWVNPLALGVFLTAVVITVRSWSWSRVSDPAPRTAVLLTALTPALVAVTLWTWDSPLGVQSHLWTMMTVYLVTALLAFNNFPVAAWVCSLSCLAVVLAWTWLHPQASDLRLETLLVSVILPWAANRLQHSAFSAMAASARLAATHRQQADAWARDLAADAARRTRGQRVDTLARPLLERLAAGERTEAPVRVEAARLEAHLRDDLRARCFRDTDVTRAANDARRAGVWVELMDDGALADAPDRLRAKVIAAAVEALDAATSGSVIVRVGPPGREIAATILTQTADGRPHRLEIPAEREVTHAS